MSLITEKDVNGFSAVHYAAKKGDVKVTKNAKLSATRIMAKILLFLSTSINFYTHVSNYLAKIKYVIN